MGPQEQKLECTIDASGVTRLFPHFWEVVVGSGGADLPLRSDLLSQYQQIHERLGVQYVRFHGILHDNLGIYHEDKSGKPHFDFTKLDRLYDSLLEVGIRPFVELSFMPEALASKDIHIFSWRGNTSLPKDYKKWEMLIKAFGEHCVKRYGIKEVRKWYFEIWNEPNLVEFWPGSQQDYWKLYDYAAKALKEVNSCLKVGGPASGAGMWIKEIIEHCDKENFAMGSNQSPLDFVSYHGYPTDKGFVVGGGPFRYQGIDYWRELSKLNHQLVRQSNRPDLEIHVTEWNSSPSARDPEHDRANNAAYICQAVNDVQGRVDTFSYWTVSDIFREEGFPDREFHGGFGLFTVHGLKKPSYWAFELLHRLKGPKLRCKLSKSCPGIGIMATRTTKGPAILLWYYKYPKEEISGSISMKLTIENLPSYWRSMRTRQARIDKKRSNITTVWKSMGSPNWPDQDQLDELRKIKLHENTSEPMNAQKSYGIDISLLPSSVVFIGIEGS